MNQVAASFLAHPDDAEFLCAGTLARLAELGWEIHIITCTAGDGGSMTERATDIASTRRAEGHHGAAVIGGTYHCLELYDGRVIYERSSVQLAIDTVRQIAPSIVFTHPHRDYMVDHEETSKLARMAAFIYGVPNASHFPVLPGSMAPYLYYCDPIEGRDPVGQPVPPTTIIDITDVLDTKQDMLAAHESQREWLREHHNMDKYIETMRSHASRVGATIGVDAAEAFVQDRGTGHPNDDYLAELLGGKTSATN